MKIYRIAQDNFKRLPTDNANTDAQIQNLNESQRALDYFQNVVNLAEQARAAIFNVEQELGLTNGELSNSFTESIKQAAMATEAFQLLAEMGFVTDVEMLMDQGTISNVEQVINESRNAMQSGGMGGMGGMGGV